MVSVVLKGRCLLRSTDGVCCVKELIILVIVMTSFAPISSKIKLVARKKQGVKQTRNRKQCVSRKWMDEDAKKLWSIGSIKEIGF